MGNYCDNNFENVKEYQVVVSQVEKPPRLSNSRHSEARQSSQAGYKRPIDQEVIHSIFKKPDQVFEIHSQEQREQFPAQQVISVTTDKPRKIRPKLQELDHTFYHSLGLPDYEYQQIPKQDKHLYEGVQTYQMKDSFGVKYVGEWKNDKIHGNGVLLSNTCKYIGQFKDGVKHYHGREILKDEVYEGQFETDRRKGFGIRYTPTFTQKGYFQEELIEGQIIYLDGRVEQKDKKGYDFRGDLKQENQQINKSLTSIYTDKYYQGSELPQQWYDESELQKARNQSRRY